MLVGLNCEKADKGNLEAGHCASSVPSCVADVETVAVTAHANESESMDGQETCNEGISTPRCNHVAVRQGAKTAPNHGAPLQGLDPEEEGEDKEENGDGFVIVTTGDGSRNVARGNSHEGCSKETSGWRGGHLIGKEICGVGGQARESRCEKNADVSNIDGDSEGTESVVDDAAGHHQTRIEGTSGNPTKRMPCSVIEPIPEVVESICDEILGRTEVEPRIDYRGVSSLS